MDDRPLEAEREQEAPETSTTRDSPTREAPTFQQTFVFVDTNAEQGRMREAIRVHVMRESHRSRRLGRGQTASSARGDLQIWDTGSSSSDGASQAPQTRRGSQGGSATPHIRRPNHEPSQTTERRAVTAAPSSEAMVSRYGEEPTVRLQQCSTSPISLLGAARADPFAQYPVQQARDVDVLIDYCKQWVAIFSLTGVLTSWLSDITQLANLSRELLPLYREDIVSFQVLLAFAAVHRAVMQGQRSTTEPAAAEGYALQTLKANIDHSEGAQSNGTILGVAVMANLEECRGNNSVARVHWNALKQMIRERGGLRVLREHRKLHSALLR